MKTYTKPVIEITAIANESIITLSGVGTMGTNGRASIDTNRTASSLGLNS